MEESVGGRRRSPVLSAQRTAEAGIDQRIGRHAIAVRGTVSCCAPLDIHQDSSDQREVRPERIWNLRLDSLCVAHGSQLDPPGIREAEGDALAIWRGTEVEQVCAPPALV